MLSHSQVVDFLNNPESAIFFDNPFLGITLCDTNGTVLCVNRTHSRITGTTGWIGKNFYEMVRDGYVSESATVSIIESKKEILIEQRLHNNKSFLVHGFPIFDDNNELRYILSYLMDVSQLQCLKSELDRVHHKMSRMQFIEENRIIYQSHTMQEIVDCAQTVANSDATVLITGESGVGKESIASLIHESSYRKENPFIKINCNAIPDSLLESELFGYEPGTFTGGNKQGKQGLLEKAHTGTIFFDEIGDMPPELQVKLLRVLQEREIRRLGGHKDIKIDVRVIAATNADLPALIQSKKFRQDLYYRLNVIPINMPNLHERKEDIPALVTYFANIFNEKYSKSKEFSPDALEKLMNTQLDGNIRQLRNIVERLVLLSPKEFIEPADIEKALTNGGGHVPSSPAEPVSMKAVLKNKEAEMLRSLYQQYKSSYKIAKILDVNQSTIWRKLKKYGIAGRM